MTMAQWKSQDHINSLDQNEIRNAQYFLKQLKLEQKMSKINEDFE